MKTTCKNCTKEFKGRFCPKCGQKANTERITLRQVFQEARRHIFHFDQGFTYTMRELLLRPGHTIREYTEGRRAKHIKPLKFMLWATAIGFLLFHYSGLDQEMATKLVEQQKSNNQFAQNFSQKTIAFIMGHPSVMLFSMVPVIAFSSWLLFRRRGYNYAEHFVLNTYLMGELSLASIFTMPISKMISSMTTTTWPMTMFSMTLWLGYFGWGYSQFFQTPKSIWPWVKAGLAILIGYLLLILLISILVIIAVTLFRSQLEGWVKGG